MSGRFCCILFCAATLLADESGDRAKLIGSWEGDGSVWTLQQNGDALHVTEARSDHTTLEIQCAIGSECNVKDGGHSVKVTMYYNGPKLVEMETRGSEVFKRRFGVTGDEMEIETIPIVPGGKTQITKLKRK